MRHFQLRIILGSAAYPTDKYHSNVDPDSTPVPWCRFDLHVLMVGHGKRCTRCAANGKPRFSPDGPCPLTALKGSARESQTPTPSKGPVKGPIKGPIKGSMKGSIKGASDSPDIKTELKEEDIKPLPLGVKYEVKEEGGGAMVGRLKDEGEGGGVVVKEEENGAAAVFSPMQTEHFGDLHPSVGQQPVKVEETGGSICRMEPSTNGTVEGAPHSLGKRGRRVKQEPA